MKTIPETYKKGGYSYRLIERNDHAAIYEQARTDSGAVVAYETMAIQRMEKDTTLPGGIFRERGSEFLPSSTQWGQRGWTNTTMAKARERFTKCTPPQS
jgi:hypothetical protein